jgi:cysteine-rich repeat protein
MNWRVLVVAWVIAIGACVRSDAVPCDDGRVCPHGAVCRPIPADPAGCVNLYIQCVEDAQLDACRDRIDGDPCTAGERPGICDCGTCIPGCGDGVVDAGEECDDGNFSSHDGCSSACLAEQATWLQWHGVWTARVDHVAAYDVKRRRIVIFGGADRIGPTADLWERDDLRRWHRVMLPGPPARRAAAMAYDTDREVMVLFGGTRGQGGPSAEGVLDDTWEYDGVHWREITAPAAPAPRHGAAMVFDPVRSRVVLFGGIGASGHHNDTWEYDAGSGTWSEVAIDPTGRPGMRRQHGLAWDRARQRAVLFGGVFGLSLGDTWEYTFATGWTSASPGTPQPAARFAAALAYSDSRGVVLIGGTANDGVVWVYDGDSWSSVIAVNTPSHRVGATLTEVTDAPFELVLIAGASPAGELHADIWHLTGATNNPWAEQPTPARPRARQSPAFVYDPAHRRSLLIGGRRDPAPLAEVFSFDGSAYLPDAPIPVFPSPPFPVNLSTIREAPAATYDATRERVIVFGGLTLAGVRHDDTIEGNGDPLEWIRVHEGGALAPPPRFGGGFAHDPDAGISVLFGGSGVNEPLADTWEWDGAAWTETTAASGPPPSLRPTLAYDPRGRRIVLLDDTAQTWVYADRTWSALQVLASPTPPRAGAAMVWSPDRGRLLVYGGVADTGSSTEIQTDLWELDDSTWRQIALAGSGPSPRVGPGLTYHPPLREIVLHGGRSASSRQLGDTWLLQFRSATPEEICDNGVDDDGDRQIDDADPDCAR